MAVHEPLLALLDESLARGHWRVACRRYLMLEACRTDMPRSVRLQCERLLLRCSDRELRRMQVDASRWARMSAPARAEAGAWVAASCLPPAVPPPAPVAAIRTQWQCR
ncbi:MAG TPA: hypothetical protein VF522_20800 [Ramlibacter sp.]